MAASSLPLFPFTVSRESMTTRIEKDPLGEKAVPAAALYGMQTERAVQNFPISGLRPLPAFVDAVIWIKRAAALTHRETGRLEPKLADAIVRAADEVLAGQHRDQFVVDVYQAGAGTSHNMNCNEVLANRANELLGRRARDVRAGPSQRSRQHGAVHQRRDPDRHPPRRARHPAGSWRRWTGSPVRSSPRGGSSTTS